MRATIFFCWMFAASSPLLADVSVDVTLDQVKSASDTIQLSDLSVNDTAYISGRFCYEDGKLFVPETTELRDYAESQYDATGVAYQIKVLPGRRLSVQIVDARQIQLIAKGNPSAVSTLSEIEYKSAVLSGIEGLFLGRFFSSPSCAVQREESRLAPLSFFVVEDINGFNSIAALIDSLD